MIDSDLSTLKACAVLTAVESFDMRDGPKGRPTRVKAGDSFWIVSAGPCVEGGVVVGFAARSAYEIARKGASRRYMISRADLIRLFNKEG
jgi:hypothetical protein